MFSSSQFDSNSAFSGGGFMTTQATQFNYSSPSPAKGERDFWCKPKGGNTRWYVRSCLWAFEKFSRCDTIGCLLFQVEGITPPQLVSSDSLNNPVKNLSNGYQPPSSNPSYAQNSMDGLKDCDKLVLDYLQQHSDMSDGRGIHIDELSRGLKLPLDKIMSSLFFLFVSLCMSVPGTRDLTVAVYDDMLSQKTLGDDGLAYSTIDDFHYKQA